MFSKLSKTQKIFKMSTFSYDFMIPGSRHFNPGISGLENLSKSRDFGIGIVPGFIPNQDTMRIILIFFSEDENQRNLKDQGPEKGEKCKMVKRLVYQNRTQMARKNLEQLISNKKLQ